MKRVYSVIAGLALVYALVAPATADHLPSSGSVGGGGTIEAAGLIGDFRETGAFNIGAHTSTGLDGEGGFYLRLPMSTGQGAGVITCLTVVGNLAYGAGQTNKPFTVGPNTYDQILFVIEDNGNGDEAVDRAVVVNAEFNKANPSSFGCLAASNQIPSLRPVVRGEYVVNQQHM